MALVKPLPNVRVSGAAWWLSPNRPLVALSARHLSDDHLWFSFFHEAGHLLLHSKKTVFIDNGEGTRNEAENQANDWAAGFLIPHRTWRSFVERGSFDAGSIREFAEPNREYATRDRGWEAPTRAPRSVAERAEQSQSQAGVDG